MRARKRRQIMTAVTAALALLVGFVLGRATANIGSSSVQITEIASQEEDTSYSISEEIESEENESVQETEVLDEESQEDTETGLEDTTTQEESGELIDAADETYEFSESEVVTHEAVTEVSSEETTVDTSIIEDVTLNEAPLPDGVASTLYGKTGESLFQIVVLGDSQFANDLSTDGMAYLLSQKMHANVYNLSIGGKTASVDPEEKGNTDVDSWEETCGVSMVKAVCGLASAEAVFSGFEYQMNVFNSCDFSKTDIFVIEFGVNDFLSSRPQTDMDDLGSYFTLFGALETMVLDIRNTYPDAQIFICMPTYAQFWESGTGAFLGDSNIINNGYGTLYNYAQTVSHVAGGHNNSSTVNAYENAGINIYTASEDLLDGIHMTASGMEKYVNLLSRVALRCFGYDLDEGVNPDEVDWISQTPYE